MSRGTLIEIANEVVDQYGCRETVVGDVDDEIVNAIRGAVALRAVADDLLARLTAQSERWVWPSAAGCRCGSCCVPTVSRLQSRLA